MKNCTTKLLLTFFLITTQACHNLHGFSQVNQMNSSLLTKISIGKKDRKKNIKLLIKDIESNLVVIEINKKLKKGRARENDIITTIEYWYRKSKSSVLDSFLIDISYLIASYSSQYPLINLYDQINHYKRVCSQNPQFLYPNPYNVLVRLNETGNFTTFSYIIPARKRGVITVDTWTNRSKIVHTGLCFLLSFSGETPGFRIFPHKKSTMGAIPRLFMKVPIKNEERIIEMLKEENIKI